jgi:hypothetical protein
MLNRAGRLTLVTLVLSSMPTYHLTVFPLIVWARKKIDKIVISFLWKGEENTNGGHSLVNWPTICRPKDLGGLVVSDLERFGRTLRLRWLWQEWGQDPKPWVGLGVPCKDTGKLLFNSSTTVTIGNGNKARFLAPQLARWRGTQVLSATPIHACAQEEQDGPVRATQW